MIDDRVFIVLDLGLDGDTGLLNERFTCGESFSEGVVFVAIENF